MTFWEDTQPVLDPDPVLAQPLYIGDGFARSGRRPPVATRVGG